MRHRTIALYAVTVTLTSVIFALGVGASGVRSRCDRRCVLRVGQPEVTSPSARHHGHDRADVHDGDRVHTRSRVVQCEYDGDADAVGARYGRSASTAGMVSGLSSPWSSASCMTASLHTKSSSGSSYIARWMAPSDVSNLLKVGITLVAEGKNAEVTMQNSR